ncbi:ras-induced vulval development antagonist-domain-containing protein [Desarmillaria tabescens]|uniref:Ras-induced vulval development antagonist-domain-containing protein n=1 Tax=Armillaria tabescens TaxID=1929756 RepID=A0AA39K6I3_ARMTA|nr:ras-induced vulval development antagonist-domain-containing protein [Desarmillaria tabescens]KAK0455474.1 ras-induced vulval development antagonist-domain-containing protein [Desarmillaria tabescens]
MAMVHPSRMGLVPRDPEPSQNDRRRGRTPSPRRPRRSPTPTRSRSRDRRGRGRHEDRSQRDEYEHRGDRRTNVERRASPEYDDYRRPESGREAPWRQPENMYPNRRGGGDSGFHGGSKGGGTDFMESRRLQRESMTVNVWPPSPKAPARSVSPKRKKSSKKSKRARSPSITDDSSEEEERRRRERRKRREREREKKKESKRHRSRSWRSKELEDDDEKERKRHRRRHSESRSPSVERRRRSGSRGPSPGRNASDEEEWVVKSPILPAVAARNTSASTPNDVRGPQAGDGDSDTEVGPQPIAKPNSSKKFDERSYGGALLRGEGSAMAAFLQEGGTDARIPRRGEIGLTSDEIAKYEDVGYVMSGSRHRRMNAVRMRKENQVISAEEKRGILKLQREERERREAILREEFSELVEERLKGPDARPARPS